MRHFRTGVAVTAGVAALALVTGCAGSSGEPTSYGSSSSSVTSAETTNSGRSDDYESLDCSELQYLARKYSSIADSALSASGDSPAVIANQMQGMQAANLASKLYGIMGDKGCSIDS